MEGEEERPKAEVAYRKRGFGDPMGLNLTSIPYSFIDPGKYYFVLIF